MSVPFVQKSILYIERTSILRGGKNIILSRISDEILKTKSGREDLQGEFSCRFLAGKVKYSFSYVARILKELVREGYLKVVETGKKGLGTIYKLVMLPAEIVEKKAEKPSNSFFCEQENTKNCDMKDTNINNNSSINILNHSIEMTSDFKKSINIGRKILKKNGFENINEVTDRILNRIKNSSKEITNLGGYFVQSCKNEKSEAKNSIPGVKTTKEYIQKLEGKKGNSKETLYEKLVNRVEKAIRGEKKEEVREEKNDYEAGLETLKASYPEEVREVELELKKEYKVKWQYAFNKAEIIVKRFAEKYS